MVTLPQNNYTQAFQAVLTMYIYIISVTMEGTVHAERFYTQYANAHTYKKYCYYNQVVTFRYLSNLVVEVFVYSVLFVFVETSGQRCQESHCQDSSENTQSRRQGRQIRVAT